ncbi:ImmA/IrrE family metallo-endopeptidase [Sphingomonas endolithica]|uniref:ImmA/IrrE family metallo-endopeptidase n=1 Tax=Sphingomonas endolithica TaxID=2972485 RepID=UPI0021AFCE9A|nr:ImmA/IrrE family metallo-endopeptidase [Sphingomonas sp. ZFBP2030]
MVAGLNPEILTWARETAGLDLETAARKIGLNAARGVSGADRLAALEAGDGTPTMAQLRNMSQNYHRPLLTFYMTKVPVPAELGQDFRSLPDQGDPSNVLLATLLRDVKARQSLVRDALEDDEDVSEVALVGSQAGVRDAARLSNALVEAIGFSRAEFRARASAEEAFGYLRALAEARGVFVLLAGDCGHWSTAIDVGIFRGFAIADEVAPFIVVNDQDAKAAWSFTLLHELAHLLIGESGVSGGPPQGDVEQLCNDTAAASLITQAEVASVPLVGGARDVIQIDALAQRARVSRSMIAYQLFRAGRLTRGRWEELRDQFRTEWLALKARTKEKNRGSTGGPDWYVVRRHRLGAALLSIARQGMADGSLTPTRAARMLGVKPMAVYPLLAEPRRATA